MLFIRVRVRGVLSSDVKLLGRSRDLKHRARGSKRRSSKGIVEQSTFSLQGFVA